MRNGRSGERERGGGGEGNGDGGMQRGIEMDMMRGRWKEGKGERGR